MSKLFALIGSNGYIAPRHIKAITAVGGHITASLDPKPSQEALGTHFTSEEAFFNHINNHKVNYVSICSPSHLHKAHCIKALEAGANVICEKPLGLSAADIDEIIEAEQRTGYAAFTIRQLRYHPEIIRLSKQDVSHTKAASIVLHLPRPKEYFESWKANASQAGGLAFNIGVHYFDLLTQFFGETQTLQLHKHTPKNLTGQLQFKHTKATFNFQLLANNKPKQTPKKVFTLDDLEVNLFEKSTDLHQLAYQNILANKGITAADSKPIIQLCENINNPA